MKTLILPITIVLFFGVTSLLAESTQQEAESHSVSAPAGSARVRPSFESEVIRLTNEYREARNLSQLKYNARLGQAAMIHAQNMAHYQQMGHTLGQLPSNVSNLINRANSVGYAYRSIAENVGYNYRTPQAVVQGWINSPAHRQNIVNPRFIEIGVAVRYSIRGEPYWCQVFGSRPIPNREAQLDRPLNLDNQLLPR